MKQVLIVDDEKITLRALREEFSNAGYAVTAVTDGEAASNLIPRQHFDLILLDMQLPGKTGLEVLKECHAQSPETIVIMITAFASVENAVTAMRAGASDYITKPYDIDDMLAKVEKLLEAGRRGKGHEEPTAEVPSVTCKAALLGEDPQILKIKETINKVKDISTAVMLTGESGTGKGIVAKRIHYFGSRSEQPFVHINCAAIPENLLESELFGHERGAFTGATQTQRGKFEQAGGGTIFLDEIGLLPLPLQSKLLNVLQEYSFERVGGSTPIPLKARIISATNADLERDVEQGRFREDLYFRLNVVRIDIPPLRYRKGDIPALTQLFLSRFEQKLGKTIREVSPEFSHILMHYDWPGNVRELQNAMESAVALCSEGRLTPDTLPMRITQQMPERLKNTVTAPTGFKAYLEQQEAAAILSALEMFHGHREKTAQYLGISKRTLQYKLKNLNISGGQ